MSRMSVLIPSYCREQLVGKTVEEAWRLPGVVQVVVVDDGSADRTGEVAAQAGATVIRLERNLGKASALMAGLGTVSGETVLLLDDDLGESVREAAKLLPPLASGDAQMAVAVLPRAGKAGFGLVVRLARCGLWLLTGKVFQAPISGQRAIRSWVLEGIRPARGFGWEIGLTLQAARRGATIVEVPLEMSHAATGRDLAGFCHRGRQFWDALLALLDEGMALSRISLAALLLGIAVLCLWASLTEPLLLLPLLAVMVGAGLLLPVALLINNLPGFRRANYLGWRLPGSMGVLVPLTSILWARWSGGRIAWTAAGLALAFGLLGLVDDLWARPGAAGLRGHLSALLHGRLTTGGLKAIGGGMAAIAAGWAITGSPYQALLAGLLIALCANLVNLLDLRPGRAIKGYFLLSAVALTASPGSLQALAPGLAAALALTPMDFSARGMLGDAGSNPLGALAGLALVIALPWFWQVAAVVALAGVHLYCERGSLSGLIARVRPLRWLDGLGTIREAAIPCHPERSEGSWSGKQMPCQDSSLRSE